MKQKKIQISIVICIFLIPIILFTIFYLKSDKFKLRELYRYIKDDYKVSFKYDNVTIDEANKLCVIRFENKIDEGDEFVKQTSIVVNKMNEFLHKNSDYLISGYRIEIWFNFEPCGELFELRNYDNQNKVYDSFIYLYKYMQGIKLKSVANYYPNIKFLNYMCLLDEDYEDLKLFSNLEYADFGFNWYQENKEMFSKDFPNIQLKD